MKRRAFYTGTLRTYRHYFWISSHRSELSPEDILAAVPDFIQSWAGMWDGGLLENSRTPDVENGKVIAVPAKGPWIAFCWWDRSINSRSGSNSGFYVSGFEWEERSAALAFASTEWPDVIKRQRHPLCLTE